MRAWASYLFKQRAIPQLWCQLRALTELGPPAIPRFGELRAVSELCGLPVIHVELSAVAIHCILILG